MAFLPENLSYTEKDFDALVARLDLLMNSVLPQVDTKAFGAINILKETFAWVGDVLLFYQDNQALESLMPTARLRQSILAHAAKLAFIPAGRTSSTVDLLVRLDDIPTNDVEIADGLQVSTDDASSPVVYQVVGGVTIPAGQDPPEAFVTAENSQNATDDFESSGLANQTVILASTPYVDDSLVVVAQNGVYEHANRQGLKVSNFFDSGPTDLHFVVTTDEQDRARVQFGDGVNGEIPQGVLSAVYKVGGGSAGRVGPGTLVVVSGTFTDVVGNPVVVSVINPSESSPGTDAMSVAEIRVQAPRSVRVSDRTVSREDYEIGAEGVPGVARALMLTSDQFAGMPENTGFLYIVPDTGGIPTTALKAEVLEEVTVTKPNTITFRTEVKDPLYAGVDIGLTIYKRAGFTGAQVAANIRSELESFFAILNDDGTPNDQVTFGAVGTDADGLSISEISLIGDVVSRVVTASTGVRKIGALDQDLTINGVHEDFSLTVFEFPRLGEVSIADGDTGEIL